MEENMNQQSDEITIADDVKSAIEAAEENNNDSEEKIGNIKIAVDVVTTIAGIATTEIEGVASMYGSIAGGIAEILGAKKNPGKGVKVEMKEDVVVVDVFVVIDYGVRIPELAWEIQENVKESIETMTGLSVEKVNIHVEGVSFDKDKEKKKENAEAQVSEDEEITD